MVGQGSEFFWLFVVSKTHKAGEEALSAAFYRGATFQVLYHTQIYERGLLKELPFPIQRIQSDQCLEFIGLEFQDALHEQHIKFRPNRPRAPHLNGKIERSQRTDRMEFWATIDLKAPREQLEEQLALWKSFYNSERTHSSLYSKTPNQRLQEVQQLVPTHQQVQQAYGPTPQPYVTNRHYH